MISVGIHDNIELVKAEINDKGTLIIGLKKSVGAVSLEDMLNSGSDASTAEDSQEFFIWPFKIDEYNKDGDAILKSALNLKRTLTHILKGYMTEAEIEAGWNLLNGLAIEMSEVKTKLAEQSNIDKLYANLASQFVSMITPFIGKGLLFRVKLTRQSAKKHFSSIPKVGEYNNLETEGFWESMDIKKEATGVKYSNYELGYRKGNTDAHKTGTDLSDPTPNTETSAPDPKETAAAAEMFGGSEG